MGLLGGKKSTKINKSIKLDDYVENKLLNLKKTLKDNKTLIICTLLGCTYYFVKNNFLV
jgi:hypothetical protein